MSPLRGPVVLSDRTAKTMAADERAAALLAIRSGKHLNGWSRTGQTPSDWSSKAIEAWQCRPFSAVDWLPTCPLASGADRVPWTFTSSVKDLDFNTFARGSGPPLLLPFWTCTWALGGNQRYGGSGWPPATATH